MRIKSDTCWEMKIFPRVQISAFTLKGKKKLLEQKLEIIRTEKTYSKKAAKDDAQVLSITSK